MLSGVRAQLPGFDFFSQLYDLRANGRGDLIAVGWSSAPSKWLGAIRTVVAYSNDSGKTWSIVMDKPGSLNCRPPVLGNPDQPMLINLGCIGGGQALFLLRGRRTDVQERRFYRRSRGTFERVRALDDGRWVAISRENQSLFAWISDSGGAEWRGKATGFAILSGDPHLEWQSMITLIGGVVLVYVGDGQILRSADRGESWKLIDMGLPRKGKYSLGASCTDGHGLVVFGGGQGMLVRSIDGGLTWERGRLH